MKIICDFSVFYLDETLPKGSIGVECGEALLKHGYKLKFFNTINFSKSMRYNPMAYIHSEKDVLKLVTALMTNTKGEGQGGDPFWDKAERLLLVSLIASMLQSSMMQMDVGPLFGLFLQSFFIGITMRILSIVIFVIVYGRMIEIYMMVSLAPVPMATWGNHEQSHVGQNYLRSLFALGFQGFLILICVAIYAVLLQNVAISGDAINSIWSIVGYTVLLCFTLFKTGSVARSILGAH